MATVLELGSLVCAGGAAWRSLATSGFFFSDLGDWYSLPDSKSDVRERPQANGAFGIATDWRRSLAYSVTGLFVGASHQDAQMAKRTLMLAVARGRSIDVAVTDVDGRFTRVSSVRSVIINDDHGNRSFRFTIDLVAFDPFRYGDPVTQTAGVPASGGGLLFPLGTTPTAYWDFGADGTSGRVSVTNEGTAPTWSLIVVTGGLEGGFVATDVTTNQSVRFERLIPDASVVTINQRTGRASIDGASNDVSGFLTVRDFFQIPAGETHQIQFSPLGAVTGDPSMSLTSNPAYL